MRLSETQAGKSWLSNFPSHDLETAELLLDSLRVVTFDELQRGIAAAVSEVARQVQGHVALYPARKPRLIIGPQRDPDNPDVIPEPDTDRTQDGNDGSELVVAKLLRDIRSHLSAEGLSISNYLPIGSLRHKRCRAVIIVDDYSGSGDAAISCVEAWRRNPSIRSWTSFGWLAIHYVTYAASSFAEGILPYYLESSHGDFIAVEKAHDFSSADWTIEQRSQIEELVRRYSRRQTEAFGWKGSAGLMLFAHASPPNNLPAVFTQRRGRDGKHWQPLVQRKQDAFRARELQRITFRPVTVASRAATQLGQEKLAQSIDFRNSEHHRELILVLAALIHRQASIDSISAVLKKSKRHAARLVEDCRNRGLIAVDRLNLTDAGWQEIRHARRPSPRRPLWHSGGKFAPTASPYYPFSLRRGDDV